MMSTVFPGVGGFRPAGPFDLRSVLRSARAVSPALWWTGLAMLAAALLMPALMWFDPRLINGISVWVKPLKFQLSSGVYLLTLALVMALLPAASVRSRAGRYVVWAAVAGAVFEVVYITWRASRGEASHFNIATPAAALMYSLMGVGATAMISASGVLGATVLRSRAFMHGDTLRWGIGLGLLLGCVLGAVAGGYMSSRTGHWVGGSMTDAGGLAVFKWSRDGGDLRVAHFFGLHAMHFIPAFALAARALWAESAALRATLAFAAVYSALTLFTFAQALMARPLI